MSSKIQRCQRCAMDTTDSDISFDKDGICNHCTDYLLMSAQSEADAGQQLQSFERLVAAMKEQGKGKEYDCLIGISGGVDSTYLAYVLVNTYGLRPLAVHLDNGWNSKLAVKNIRNIIARLDIDLHTHVIDWEEFKSLQLAFLRASVIDIEMLSDHAINASLYRTAHEHGISYILKGFNNVTERIMPKSWTFTKNDVANIRDINAKHGTMEIKTFPTLGSRKMTEYKKTIKTIFPFNYIDFDKDVAKDVIVNELKWQDYGGKHYESIFTRFYQGYILPQKFDVDKRKAHYSNLICAGKITRQQALEDLQKPTYDEALIQQDYEYVLKKLNLTKEAFEEIMATPVRSHFEYQTEWRSKLSKKYKVGSLPAVKLLKKIFTNE